MRIKLLPVDVDALYEHVGRLPASIAGPILAAVGLARSAARDTRCSECLTRLTQSDLEAPCLDSTSQDQPAHR